MLYICLKKYSSIFSVVSVILVLFVATTAFLFYGLKMLSLADVFVVVNTEINAIAFYNFCAAWYIADIFCLYRAVKIYRQYVQINSN